jgi:ribosomal protein L32
MAGGALWRWCCAPSAVAAPLLDWLLLAVPKKRTTHAKKRMRMSQKYLKTNPSLVRCSICAGWKKPHTYCAPACPGRKAADAGFANL